MSDEQAKTEAKNPNQDRIERMDKVADSLLALVENEATSEAQKGRLFAQVLAWYKVRATLIPSDDGDKLKEMQRGLKDGKRDRSTERARERVRDGHAIENIIRTLPKIDRSARGNPNGTERQGLGAAGDGRGIRVDGGGDVEGRNDGPVDRPVV